MTTETADSTPIEGEVGVPLGPVPEGRLFTPEHVGLATFLGSVVAGAVLMAINWRRLGEPAAGTKTLVVGVLASAAVLAIAFVLPEGAGYALPLATVFALHHLAKRQQGEAVAAHVALGGKTEPWWKPVGIGVAGAVVVLGVVFGFTFFVLPDELGTPVDFGQEQRVFYQGEATEEDARSVGGLLRETRFFDDTGPKDVFVRRQDGELSVSFVLIDDAWDEPRNVEAFERLREDMARLAFAGEPVVFYLCDAELRTQRTLRGVPGGRSSTDA